MKVEKITAQEVNSLFEGTLFEKEIKSLKSGEAIKFPLDEWPLKTEPRSYYHRRMNGTVKVRYKRGECFLIKI